MSDETLRNIFQQQFETQDILSDIAGALHGLREDMNRAFAMKANDGLARENAVYLRQINARIAALDKDVAIYEAAHSQAGSVPNADAIMERINAKLDGREPEPSIEMREAGSGTAGVPVQKHKIGADQTFETVSDGSPWVTRVTLTPGNIRALEDRYGAWGAQAPDAIALRVSEKRTAVLANPGDIILTARNGVREIWRSEERLREVYPNAIWLAEEIEDEGAVTPELGREMTRAEREASEPEIIARARNAYLRANEIKAEAEEEGGLYNEGVVGGLTEIIAILRGDA